MSDVEGPGSRIARWLCTAPPPSPVCRELAVQAVVDTVACMIAGRRTPEVRALREVVGLGAGPSSLVGAGSADPGTAALVNGTAAHALDFDDNFTPGMSHASAVLVPALLALGEARRASGSRVVDAYLRGLQAQAMVGSLLGYGHYERGWHPTSTVGTLGTAAAAAWLLSGEEAVVAGALTSAVSRGGGLTAQFGSPMKPVHAGLAARAAVESALFSMAGVRGSERALSGPQGFVARYGDGDEDAVPLERMAPFEDEWVMLTHGVLPKRHPSCGSTHLVLDSLLELRAEHGVTDAEVMAVDAVVGPANARNLPFDLPRSGAQARFSMPYCVDVALRRGRLRLEDFTDDSVRSQAVPQRLSRITVRPWSTTELLRWSDPSRPPHRVRLRLADGRLLERSRTEPRGHRSEPFEASELRDKFADCCAGLPDASSLLRQAQDLDTLPDVGRLGRRLGALTGHQADPRTDRTLWRSGDA